MRAGLLARNKITILRYTDEKTNSGQIKKVKEEVATLRCNIIKSKGSEKDDKKAFEIIQVNTLIFHIRFYHSLLDTDIILFENQEYKITLIDRNVWDRSIKITAQKIND